jgi:hypothetical protein
MTGAFGSSPFNLEFVGAFPRCTEVGILQDWPTADSLKIRDP